MCVVIGIVFVAFLKNGTKAYNVVVTPDDVEQIAEQMDKSQYTSVGSYEVNMNSDWVFANGSAASSNAYVIPAVTESAGTYSLGSTATMVNPKLEASASNGKVYKITYTEVTDPTEAGAYVTVASGSTVSTISDGLYKTADGATFTPVTDGSTSSAVKVGEDGVATITGIYELAAPTSTSLTYMTS